MVDLHTDQAAGLRRLFPRREAQIIAFAGVSRATALLVGGCARALAGAGAKVLILDEQRGTHSALADLGLTTRYDLAQALQGDVRLEAATVFKGPKLHALTAARAARGEGAGARADREVWQRCTRNYDWILINAAPEPSRFVAAAQACVLVVAANRASVTAAYGQLKRISAVAANTMPCLAVAADAEDALPVVRENLIQAARLHLGIEVEYAGALEVGPPASASQQAWTHARIAQLLSRAAGSGVAAGDEERRRAVSEHGCAPNCRNWCTDTPRPAAAGFL